MYLSSIRMSVIKAIGLRSGRANPAMTGNVTLDRSLGVWPYVFVRIYESQGELVTSFCSLASSFQKESLVLRLIDYDLCAALITAKSCTFD